jgi:hypothetical protein
VFKDGLSDFFLEEKQVFVRIHEKNGTACFLQQRDCNQTLMVELLKHPNIKKILTTVESR